MNFSFHFEYDYIKEMIIVRKKKQERDLNISKNVMLESIVTKRSFNTFYLMYLKIFV